MKMPDFLVDTKLNDRDYRRLEKHMANWLTAHAYIRTLEPNPEGLKELKLMIYHEMTFGKRLHMLQRLRARFNNLRIKYEDKQLFSLAR